ncbi:uncharacterized protein LOC117341732 [Pecten maximus]|uniref:uncharacterized protein LOC117341732 n=1 Tax=Pecten maximus TaxID=6579 RepID=UPI001457F61A|nr:uncharacterized protein LOC117341732 [Pecten maximus]
MLSALNSVFDPIGFLAPFTIQGRILWRELTAGSGWDEPLSESHVQKWDGWMTTMNELNSFGIGRMFVPLSVSTAEDVELHIFADASTAAISAVGYVRMEACGTAHIGFAMGKAKLAPSQSHTVPRLELCAAVLVVDVGATLSEALGIPLDSLHYYSDSKVVLGYLSNTTRRFYTYVANRVQKVLQTSRADQWSYIPTHDNPADQATRCSMTAKNFDMSLWIKGPQRLQRVQGENPKDGYLCFPLIDPEGDAEIRSDVKSFKLSMKPYQGFGTARFERFSRWENLVRAIMFLKNFARRLAGSVKGSDSHRQIKDTDLHICTEKQIIKQVQQEVFCKEIDCLLKGKALCKDSSIQSLSPFIDEDCVLRVGGRLNNSDLDILQRNPVLIPKHHIAVLLIRHYHEKVLHQGRHLTEGAIRSAGYWIIGMKRLVSSVIHKCVKCRRLRGTLGCQKMSELPIDRLTPGPPFTSVGMDCFGPWQVTTRRTRGGQADSKRWAVLFTCLTTRAVHIEVIEQMSSSAFINALRRFTAIRGKVKIYRSDRGSNFIGSVEDLGINVESDGVKQYLSSDGSTWKFNAPHSSHMGGVWERMIGVTRRILDSLLMNIPGGGLTHEVLTIFLAEASAVINSRPLTPVSSDLDNPYPLSPSVLLTQKSDSIVDIVIPTDVKNMYRAQWKRVQILAEIFWRRWKSEFLQTLQCRRKWTSDERSLHSDDVVLLRDKEVARNYWLLGVVTRTITSEDGKIRKAEVRVITQSGKPTTYTRPVNEMVVLIPFEDSK